MKNIVAKFDVHTLDNGDCVIHERERAACSRVCAWKWKFWILCIAPMAYIIGFTNYKAAFLWCCANVFRRIDIEHTEKSLSITFAQSGQRYMHVNVCILCLCEHKREKKSARWSMIFFSLPSSSLSCFLLPRSQRSISGWTLIFSITLCFFSLSRNHRLGVFCCFQRASRRSDLCEILFRCMVFRLHPHFFSKWFNFVYRSALNAFTMLSINLHKNP